MPPPSFRNWRSVHGEVLRRIHAREWVPGDLIPNEVDLALEFGCARSTVNRALRSLAENGMLDQRRKAGTRVAMQPVAKATLEIAVIRKGIEDRGQKYGYQLIERIKIITPFAISGTMQASADMTLLYVGA
jgi:GntR family histidine utilization transcriptional repressor